MARKQKEYDGLMHNMTNPDLPAEVVANIGKEMQRLLDEMAGLRDAQPPKDYTTDQIYTWLEALKNAADDKAIHLLIERIDVASAPRKKEATDFNITSTLKSVVGKMCNAYKMAVMRIRNKTSIS